MRIIIALLLLLMAAPIYGEIAAKTYSIVAYDEISDSAGELVWFSVDDPLNSLVEITNTANGKKIVARTIKVIEPYWYHGIEMIGYLPRKERALLGQPDPVPVMITTRIVRKR